MWHKATHYRSASIAALVVGSLWAAQGAGATTVSISGEQFTGTPPVGFEVPFPTMTSGSFTHFDTTSIPGQVTSVLGPSSSAAYSIASMTSAFTMLWRSPSAGDLVQFFSGVNGTGQLEGSFTGADLLCGGCGFSLVTFSAIGGSIGSVVLSDSGPTAFEYSMPEEPVLGLPSPPSPSPVVTPPVVTPPVVTPPVITPPVITPPVITPPVITPPVPVVTPETPLPGALPLFLGGLAALGLFGRRKHNQPGVVAPGSETVKS